MELKHLNNHENHRLVLLLSRVSSINKANCEIFTDLAVYIGQCTGVSALRLKHLCTLHADLVDFTMLSSILLFENPK